MCAIAGLIGLPVDEAIQQLMQSTMKNRGPDNQGVYRSKGTLLIHARLAVIDPAGGNQPMTVQSGGETYTIVYNGELYNTQELRYALEQAGHSFMTRSDTEVLLRAYLQWGDACVEKCNGIFAFAIWEDRAQRLFLARDRMGVKPLFFSRHQGGLIFASEIKTILCYPTVKPKLTAQGAAEILLLGPGRTPGCGVFSGIEEVMPACCGYFENGKLTLRRYWQLQDTLHEETFEETAESVRYLVTDAIKRQMVSDVPLGTFLSGGLDSSIITAVCAREMRKQGKRLKTFSVDYVDNDKYFVPNKFQPNSDGHYIRLMQEYLDTEHHWCMLSPRDLFDAMDEAVLARDLPGMADVDISLLLFCRKMKGEVTVALSGECADEIFGGYPWYRDPEIRAMAGFPWAQNTKQRLGLLHPSLCRKIGEDYIQSRYEETCKQASILPNCSATERRMKEMVSLNQSWFMQTLLDRKDRMSMYSGLEVRVPFCDYRIAQYLYGVPWEYKDYMGKEKGLLRYAMGDLLPQEVLWRKKSPYPKTWSPVYLELVKGKLEELLLENDTPLFSLVNKEGVKTLLQTEYVWPWYGQLMRLPQTICYLLQIDFWLRNYKIELEF